MITTRTDGTGWFSAQIAVPAQHLLIVTARISGRPDVEGVVAIPSTVDAVDTGDIPIPRGVTLHARVVDESGLPVPGILVRFVAIATGQDGNFRSERLVTASSDPNGTLARDQVLACGTWSLRTAEHVKLIRPAGLLEIVGEELVRQVTIETTGWTGDTVVHL